MWSRRADAVAAGAALAAALLAACSGSGSSGSAQPGDPGARATLVELATGVDPRVVRAPECALADDPIVRTDGAAARYPPDTGVFRGWSGLPAGSPTDSSAMPLRLRVRPSGGLLVAHRAAGGLRFSAVDPDGTRSMLELPGTGVFDVAPDDTIWLVADGFLSRTLADGGVQRLAPESGAAAPADGPLGSAPIGPVALIAAGAARIGVLVERLVPQPSTVPARIAAAERAMRVIERGVTDAWTVRTVALPPGLLPDDVVSELRAGPADALYLLVNRPFARLESGPAVPSGVGPPPYAPSTYVGRSTVWALDAADRWRELGSAEWPMQIGVSITFGYLRYGWAFDARSLAIEPSGRAIVGGAGALRAVTPGGAWEILASSEASPGDALGRDGVLGAAAFASASALDVDATGLVFYDGATCQLRRLQGDRLATLSGPRLGGPDLRDARLLGVDAAGALLFSPADGTQPAGSGPSAAVARPALARLDLATPGALPQRIASRATAIGAPACTLGSSYRAGVPECRVSPILQTGIEWLEPVGDAGPAVREGHRLLVGASNGPGTVATSAEGWPGVLMGDAPSGPAGAHVTRGTYVLFGPVRIDPPLPGPVYHEPRLYAVELSGGRVSVVAGASIASTVHGGARIDLSPVAPVAGMAPLFVQARRDGGYWLGNAKEVWLLDAAGRLSRVAGTASSATTAIDGRGDGASFAGIAALRVLDDDRLLVTDLLGHVVRVVGGDGSVRTVVGTPNVPGFSGGPLPGGLASPVDALAVGADVYVTTRSSGALYRAIGAL